MRRIKEKITKENREKRRNHNGAVYLSSTIETNKEGTEKNKKFENLDE
jgi:hypothetical protein